jgi:C4-dicarboxylate transporter, DctM subunit
MNEMMIGIIGVLGLFVFFLIGMEMAFAMAIIAFAGYSLLNSPQAALFMMSNDLHSNLENYGMTVVPLFVVMGQIVFNGGLANKIYDGTHKFFGHIAGGLAIATVVGASIFKAMCGSSSATTATFASVAVPEMDNYGYDKKLSTGIVATVGVLGLLIPPAATLILLGIITQQSIGRLFMAGLLPGLMLAVLYIGVILGWGRINPAIGPKGKKYSWGDRIRTLPDLLWPALIFVVMIGGLMAGFFTPTEAGAIGLFSVLVITIVKGDIKFGGIKASTMEALKTTSMIILLITASTMFGHFIAITNIPAAVSDLLSSLPVHRHVKLCIILAVYLLGGSFMDDLAFLILATPIFFPSMVTMGYDPLWICIALSVNLGIGSVIPPVALNVFIVSTISKVPSGIVYKGVYPFLVSLVVCLVLLFIFPQIVTYLPAVAMK